ncbi:beta-hydroxyacyl-ACP dehydratase [Aquimarina sp. BL5]|uniref:3-hydroxyacyl-ACP dehydratase FabZ family protein n=1 Tax=Aquimarina sp. BL5 TaxID=1714860 RepID=UPI000E4A2FEF|nr:3-hydroxyacyl-ACP dehydratase FabZ family protein [Aquimarina sp. BL5]AXT49656.1 beta-hydroxyacyl-ACP dehydratase [Aquimarina sp. BL5]RKN00865.1 beta-hydroxyacyl-ACP dehydratase [Aquimarina sp. BL5]
MTKEQIIEKLPYEAPFLFVDEILEVNEDGIKGYYTLKPDEYFYKGHFKDHPITPGVILTEIMAQIGLVCLGIFILKEQIDKSTIGVAMSSTGINFYKSVLPGEKVLVKSEKEYFRFNKLKCKVEMFNEEQKLIAKGEIAGMIV